MAPGSKMAVATPPGWKPIGTGAKADGTRLPPVEHGGQGLPQMLSMATLEIWNAASMALLCRSTMGAIEALHRHGSGIAGEISCEAGLGRMDRNDELTEPQAGSTVGAATRAERQEDGTYRLFGQKIFITYGEHDLTDNILHLVLAPRLTHRPTPAVFPRSLRPPRRTVRAISLLPDRAQMGIHASPTCTMIMEAASASVPAPSAG